MPSFIELLELFYTFFKIGLFTFGGGYAMIPLISDEVVAHGWLTASEVLNFIGIAESTPGPIAINMATFIGASQGGILGAIFATLGVVLPSFIIILLIATIMKRLLKFAGVKAFLTGIRPVVVGLIVATGITITLSVITAIDVVGAPFVFDWRALTIFLCVAVEHFVYKIIRKKNISAIFLILTAALLGMLLYGLLGFV